MPSNTACIIRGVSLITVLPGLFSVMRFQKWNLLSRADTEHFVYYTKNLDMAQISPIKRREKESPYKLSKRTESRERKCDFFSWQGHMPEGSLFWSCHYATLIKLHLVKLCHNIEASHQMAYANLVFPASAVIIATIIKTSHHQCNLYTHWFYQDMSFWPGTGAVTVRGTEYTDPD